MCLLACAVTNRCAPSLTHRMPCNTYPWLYFGVWRSGVNLTSLPCTFPHSALILVPLEKLYLCTFPKERICTKFIETDLLQKMNMGFTWQNSCLFLKLEICLKLLTNGARLLMALKHLSSSFSFILFYLNAQKASTLLYLKAPQTHCFQFQAHYDCQSEFKKCAMFEVVKCTEAITPYSWMWFYRRGRT